MGISPSAGFSIIQAGPQHLESVAPLFDAYRVFYRQESDPALSRTFISARLDAGDSVIFLATGTAADAGEALGFTQLYPTFSSVSAKRLWILNDLYVAASVRRGGVGRALMERARRHAQETGAKGLVLATELENKKAQGLYESLGYRRAAEFYHYKLDL